MTELSYVFPKPHRRRWIFPTLLLVVKGGTSCLKFCTLISDEGKAVFVEQAVGAAVTEVLQHRDHYFSLLSDIYDRIKNGEQNIYIFGAGGTGKSTLAEILEAKAIVGQITGDYTLTKTEIESNVKGARFKNVWSVPGQDIYWNNVWGSLLDQLKTQRNVIVINVVAFGYHSMQLVELSQIKEFQSGINSRALNKFLEARQREEVQALKQIVGHLRTVKHLDMLTVVSKQDLWWPKRHHVKRHYQKLSKESISADTPADQTTYQDQIQRLQEFIGTGNFRHNLLSVSFGNINFKTEDRYILQKTIGGYDAGLLHANFANFARTLQQFIN